MAKSKQPSSPPEETLDNLLDRVSNAREELVAVERTLERLRSDIPKLDKRKGEPRKIAAKDVVTQFSGLSGPPDC
jgi:hypothetical protein